MNLRSDFWSCRCTNQTNDGSTSQKSGKNSQPADELKSLSRWMATQIFYFSPLKLGKMNPLLTIICFKGVGEKPPTSSKFIGWHRPPWVGECLELNHQWCYHSISLYQLAFHFKHFWHTECSLSERRTIIIRGVQQSWSRLKLKRGIHVILSWILVILDLLRSFWDLFFNHTNWVHVPKIGCIFF